jgi:hypothetical protein
MSHSFFHLTPRHTPPSDPHLGFCASLSEVEHEALMTEGMALGDILSEAIDLYATTHPDLSYGVILEALRYLTWCTQRELAEERADA